MTADAVQAGGASKRHEILFVHQNFPGQFLHLSKYLLRHTDWRLTGVGETKNVKARGPVQGMTTIGYPTPDPAGSKTHPYMKGLEAGVRRGQAVARALLQLREKGYAPDLIYAHPGWGEALFIKDVFPDTPLLLFCEFFFNAFKADLNFDPEFPESFDHACSVRISNANQLLSLPQADMLISPTQWQASTYPKIYRSKLKVMHEGINTEVMCPGPQEPLVLHDMGEGNAVILGDEASRQSYRHEGHADGEPRQVVSLDKGLPLITYVARNLEPYRGFSPFLEAVTAVQERHKTARVIIVGGNEPSYSPQLPEGQTYKRLYLNRLKGRIDLSRVHFVGRIEYATLLALFRLSAVHVYLTYPFVLSWSFLEAMAAGALIVASKNGPVEEVAQDGKNALLVDFFDAAGLVDAIVRSLEHPEAFQGIRKSARETVLKKYELNTCLERQRKLFQRIMIRP